MIQVNHHVVSLQAEFPHPQRPDDVARWVAESTAELVRELRRLCGDYVLLGPQTLLPVTVGGTLVLVNTMVGQSDEFGEADDDDEDDDAPAPPEPAPRPPAPARRRRDGWQRHSVEVN